MNFKELSSSFSEDEKKTIQEAMKKMWVFEHGGMNHMSYAHTFKAIAFCVKDCPQEEGQLRAKLRVVLGVSSRYVEEYMQAFYAFKVLKNDAGVVYVEPHN